jgi:hypothetical protein
MPRFDGTGPRGEGMFTGRGEGYCALRLPEPGSGEPAVGYAGIQGVPVRIRGTLRSPRMPGLMYGAARFSTRLPAPGRRSPGFGDALGCFCRRTGVCRRISSAARR